eukprot:scaffold2505_cov157-Skeletonema_menzelii.AAC.12
MTTKASKKSRSSNSYEYGGKSAKRSHPSYGSNNRSLSYSAAKEDDSDDANSSIASTSFQPAAQESTTSATAIHEVAVAESESIADEESTTSTTSAAADNVDDISLSISKGGDTDAAASSVSAFDADVNAAPQSSASTEVNDNSINNNTLSTILTIDDLPYAYVNMSLADSLASQKLSSRSHPPSSDKVTFASNIVVDIGVALVATVIIVFAVARGRNGFLQRQTSCDHEGEVVTDLEAAIAAGGGTAEQQDDGNISDASSIWSADDQAEE